MAVAGPDVAVEKAIAELVDAVALHCCFRVHLATGEGSCYRYKFEDGTRRIEAVFGAVQQDFIRVIPPLLPKRDRYRTGEGSQDIIRGTHVSENLAGIGLHGNQRAASALHNHLTQSLQINIQRQVHILARDWAHGRLFGYLAQIPQQVVHQMVAIPVFPTENLLVMFLQPGGAYHITKMVTLIAISLIVVG